MVLELTEIKTKWIKQKRWATQPTNERTKKNQNIYAQIVECYELGNSFDLSVVVSLCVCCLSVCLCLFHFGRDFHDGKKMVRERRRRIFVLFLVFSAPVFLFFFCCVFVFRAKLSMCICLCGGMDKQLYAINGPDLIDNQNYEGNFLWTWSDPNSTVSCLMTSFIQQKTGNNEHIK